MSIFEKYLENHVKKQIEFLTFEEYLDLCKKTPIVYASPAERMIAAIGKPEFIDTSKESRLSRIFLNKTLKVYPSFKDFYGMEETIERIVGYFTHAAQGLEERKQILYLLGPVGGGKSSLAERLKELMQAYPIYTLAIEKDGETQLSPVFESPLGLFEPDDYAKQLQ